MLSDVVPVLPLPNIIVIYRVSAASDQTTRLGIRW